MRILFVVLLLFYFSIAKTIYDLNLKFIEKEKEFIVNGTLNIKSNEEFSIYIPKNIQIIKKDKNSLEFYFKIAKSSFPEIFISQKQLPSLDKLAKYKVKIYPPKGYIPLTEADKSFKYKDFYEFEFPYKKQDINIILGKNWHIRKLALKKDLDIYLYSLNKKHKKDILKLASKYISYYEKLIGKFPYKRFSIVETYNPYGYSFPTFTTIFYPLMNKEFIYKTSLPHEILHQWFGCSAYIDFENGNWAEGLTVYLADYNFSNNKTKYRKLTLEKYEAYVDKDISLRDFKYKKDKFSEALGYGKGMFVFYMIEKSLGHDTFIQALRDFYQKNKFKIANWQNLKLSFEKISKKNLSRFFNQWINDAYVPKLNVKVLSSVYKNGFFHTKFEVKQKKDFEITLPIYIKTFDGMKHFKVKVLKKKQIFTLKTKSLPIKLYLDPNYEVFRHLKDEETDPIIHFALNKKTTIILDKDKDFSKVENKNVIFKDIDNPILKSLVDKSVLNFLKFKSLNFSKDFVYTIKNPLGNKKVLLIVNGNINYKHYGNYSFIFETEDGLEKIQDIKFFNFGYKIYNLPEIVSIKHGAFDYYSFLESLLSKKVIYIGENHTKFSNHLAQLQIIKYLYKNNKKIIIAMEMFQKPFQKVLDDYIQGKLSKREFLRKTQYYKRWGYDFKLYESILDFAKENKIKILALNIEKEIIDKVSKNGFASLTEEERKKLPEFLDFSNLSYRKFLKGIYSKHTTDKNFVHFYEAQILWDESMAHNLAKYMKKFPNYTFIVLAGNGHLRYRYGIPSRLERITGYKGIIVLNDDEIRKNISDYIVYFPEIDYKPSLKLGVLITEKNGKIKVERVLKHSVADKIGIKKGDIILKVDGFQINNIYDLKTHLTFFKKGSYVVIKRRKQNLTLFYK